MNKFTDTDGRTLSPSEYMKANRPEKFSDSSSLSTHSLDKTILDHALVTLTERNQHKDFENYARALAQREVCRNLRPSTGPEGGGDGKIDSESYPVAEEIKRTWLEGHSGEEFWAVAMSAKKTWSSKLRSDVESICSTKRGYKRILFFTNQNPRQRDRKRIEDKLTKKHDVLVTVFDRSWLVEKTIDNENQDLAYVHLGVGTPNDSPRLGPNDTARIEELDQVEARLSELSELNIVSPETARLARSAAILTRSLERPVSRVNMRFAFAEDQARQSNDSTELFRVLYDRVWTDFFWNDDATQIFARFDEMRRIVLASGDADHLSRLGTIANLLWQVPRLEGGAIEEVQKRVVSVIDIADEFAKDTHRPNNALTSESVSASMKLTLAMTARDEGAKDKVFSDAANILKRCEGLAEFSLDTIGGIIDAIQMFSGEHSNAFEHLLGEYAKTVGRRAGAAVEGEVYFDAAMARLRAERPEEAIGYLGAALRCLATDETHQLYGQSLLALAHAYGAVGLHHAARNTQLGAMAAIAQAAHRADEPIVSERTLNTHFAYAWNCLKTGHLADIILALLCVRTMVSQLVHKSDEMEKWKNRIRSVDGCLACLIIALPDSEISTLAEIPDALEVIGLFTSQATLLYRLGHKQALEENGFIEAVESWEAAERIFGLMMSQPATAELPRLVQVEAEKSFHAQTNINGVMVTVSSQEKGNQANVASMILAGFEAFTATLITKARVMPKIDSLIVEVLLGDAFSFQSDLASQSVLITWPKDLNCVETPNSSELLNALQEILTSLLGVVFSFADFETVLEELIGKERAFERALHFANSSVLRGRIYGSPNASLEQSKSLCSPQGGSYKPTASMPGIPNAIELPEKTKVIEPDAQKKSETPETDINFERSARHDTRAVLSPINMELWDAASWKGMLMAGGFAEFDEPILGLFFENPFAGRRIFEAWIQRYGVAEVHSNLRVSVLRGVDKENPSHYRVVIGPTTDNFGENFDPERLVMMVSRIHTMEPSTTVNLDRFLEDYSRHKRYRLVPVLFTPDGQPFPDIEVAIPMNLLQVSEAWQIHPGHPDMMAYGRDLSPVIPDGELDPPCFKMDEAFAAMDRGEVIKAREPK